MDSTISPARKCVSSGQTRSSLSSFSSFSSSSSCFLDDLSPASPATPLRLISTVPFSWEKLPGIPKKQDSKKVNESLFLPLPPPSTTPPTSKRHSFDPNSNKTKIKNHGHVQVSTDPFFAALVECSKEQDQEEPDSIRKVSRSLSDRFGLVSLYTSCKSTCSVSESLIYLPRSAGSLKYELIDRETTTAGD